MKIVQVELENVGHSEYMLCWLSTEVYKIKPRMVVSLKDVDGLWKVTKIYTTQDHYKIKRKWEVGGL